MSYETKALNKIATALGGSSRVQKNDILNEIAENVDGLAGVEIYICGNGEYNSETGLPIIEDPSEKVIYLVPTGEEVPNMYNEYIRKNDEWELFGSSAGGVKNITDGSAAGSIRGIAAAVEDSNYMMGVDAVAEGIGTKASGDYSHAEGENTIASGKDSHAEGFNSTASGFYSHAEGENTKATVSGSHAEGYNTTVYGFYSHAEGDSTNVTGSGAHAEGYSTKASGDYSHAEGFSTQAKGIKSHAEGSGTTVTDDGAAAHAEGTSTTASKTNAHAEGNSTTASGKHSHAEGKSTTASGESSHAEGESTKAEGGRSHAEGSGTEAKGDYSHVEGWYSQAKHRSQHVFGEYNIVDPSSVNRMNRGTYVEIVGNGDSSNRSNARTLDWSGNEVLAGKLTVGAAPTADMDVATKKYVDDTAGGGGVTNLVDGSTAGSVRGVATAAESDSYTMGENAFAEGSSSTASGRASHAEGTVATASGNDSHAEGNNTTAAGAQSHAEGQSTTASGTAAHTEGFNTRADGNYAHAEGYKTVADMYAHSEGISTSATGNGSHAEGEGTSAKLRCQHVFGSYNVEDPSTKASSSKGTYVEIVGNGANKNARSNARTLDWDGNEQLAGSLTLGLGTADKVTITAAQLKQLLAMLS